MDLFGGEDDDEQHRQMIQQELFGASAIPRRVSTRGLIMSASPSALASFGGENHLSPSTSQSQLLIKQMSLNVEMLTKQINKSDEKMNKHAQTIKDLKAENRKLQEVAVTMKITNDGLQEEVDKLRASETHNRQQIEQAERRFNDLKREHDVLKRTHEEEVRNHAELKEKYTQLDATCTFLSSDNQQLHRDVDSLKAQFEEFRISLRQTD